MKKKPIEIRKGGNVRVKIYVGSKTKNGRTYDEYKVCDYFTVPGKRRFESFASEAEARERANEIASAMPPTKSWTSTRTFSRAGSVTMCRSRCLPPVVALSREFRSSIVRRTRMAGAVSDGIWIWEASSAR